MNLKKIGRIMAILLLAVLMTAVTALMLAREDKMCMGVEIVTDTDYLENMQKTDVDIRDYILINGEKAAIDKDSNTIFIPNQIYAETEVRDLKGVLDIALNEYQLKFIYCEQFENLQQAVKDNHIFKLVAISDQGYISFDVVFTTLPVIKISTGDFMYMNGEREVWGGEMIIWSPYDDSVGDFSVKTSNIKYHHRGWTSYYSRKKNYRISFLGAEGDKRNVSLLNQGEDDDWILNAMNTDDVKIKERLCMNLWNEHVQSADYNYKMSQGEYVEVVADGVYSGLYMLQRRLDPKYLGLSDNDILFKRTNNMEYTTVEDGYEIKNSPLTEYDTYEILNDIFSKGNYQVIDPENLADVNLFMEWAAMKDNVLKNIFFVLQDKGDEYQMRFVLWDTDMSYGIVWSPNGFIYSIENALKGAAHRPETKEYVKVNPEIYDIMAEKWAVLRQGVLTEENIQEELDECYNLIINSGAYTREKQIWGCDSYGGADTKEAMESYISQKLAIMDEKYLN